MSGAGVALYGGARLRNRFPSVHASFEFSHTQGQMREWNRRAERVRWTPNSRRFRAATPARLGCAPADGGHPTKATAENDNMLPSSHSTPRDNARFPASLSTGPTNRARAFQGAPPTARDLLGHWGHCTGERRFAPLRAWLSGRQQSPDRECRSAQRSVLDRVVAKLDSRTRSRE